MLKSTLFTGMAINLSWYLYKGYTLANFYVRGFTIRTLTVFLFICNNMDVLDALVIKDERVILGLLAYWKLSAELQAEVWGFNLYKTIKEVNRSNMTKFPSMDSLYERYAPYETDSMIDDQVLQLAVQDCESLSNGKYKDVVAIFDWRGPELPVVFRAGNGNGKIVEPLWHFQEPNFDHCWL